LTTKYLDRNLGSLLPRRFLTGKQQRPIQNRGRRKRQPRI